MPCVHKKRLYKLKEKNNIGKKISPIFGHFRRVHISEKTLQCLNGEFEVEPAYGEKREETLRIAGLRTYFIKKVLKHVSLNRKIRRFQQNSKFVSDR